MLLETEIKIGTTCNNNCVFCLNDERNNEKKLDQIKKDIILAKNSGVKIINFTGGEITIKKDFFEIIDFTKKAGLEVCLQTNGRMFYYDDFCKEVISRNISLFLISFHAHNEELSRKITCTKRAYIQTKQGIINLIKYNQRLQVNVVVNKHNIEHLQDIAKHHISLGIQDIQLSWIRPQGKTADNIKELVPQFVPNLDKIMGTIDILENNDVRVAVLGVPFCLMGKYAKNCGNAYMNSIVLTNNKNIEANKIIDKRKMLLNKCVNCNFKTNCRGVFKKYIEIYGDREFSEEIQ